MRNKFKSTKEPKPKAAGDTPDETPAIQFPEIKERLPSPTSSKIGYACQISVKERTGKH